MVNKHFSNYENTGLNTKAFLSQSLNSNFFTLPQILTNGRKRHRRKRNLFQKLQPDSILNGKVNLNHLEYDNYQRHHLEEKKENDNYFGESNSNYTFSNRKTMNGHSKSNNFITRLMKHFSSHSFTLNDLNIKENDFSHFNTKSKFKNSSHVNDTIFSSLSSSSLSPSSRIFTICGIKNHGNTCFMNAILQCLSNTDLLAEYFVTNRYKLDLFKHSEITGKKFSSRAEVTEQCALLFKSLWSNSYTFDISNKFKILVSKYGKQYEGSEQHDAQEFLLWLLDRFHEDLNVAVKKKFKKIRHNLITFDRPDEIIAAETLANHMRCSSSFIRDLFQAQLRSSLVCRSCNNHSNTFDPYTCLSLPVPTKLSHNILVNVTLLKRSPRKIRVLISIEAHASLRELRAKISRLIKVPEKQLILLIKDLEDGYKELSKDKCLIQEILYDKDEIEAIETPQLSEYDELSYSSPSSPTASHLTLIWANRVGIGSNNSLFGPFFSCLILRDVSFKEIHLEIMKTMKDILRKTCDLNIIKDSSLFKLKVNQGLPGKNYLSEEVDHPLFMPTVDEALKHCEDREYRGPWHLQLIIEWDLDLRQALIIDDKDFSSPVDFGNINYVEARIDNSNRATLQDCFEMYFREERLGADNAWMCPACKKRQQCIKKLSLWSTPDVFIIHLKRFRQASSFQRTKLSTLVMFPLNGLDMNPYLTNNENGSNVTSLSNDDNFINGLLSWQKLKLQNEFSKTEDNIYDLYAVCNHHGNMQVGHYTAFCRNILDNRWYSFDDLKVAEISENSVITSDAYILFYQRSTLNLSSSCNSSTASSSTSTHSASIFNGNQSLELSTSRLSSRSFQTTRSHDNLSSSTSHFGKDSSNLNNLETLNSSFRNNTSNSTLEETDVKENNLKSKDEMYNEINSKMIDCAIIDSMYKKSSSVLTAPKSKCLSDSSSRTVSKIDKNDNTISSLCESNRIYTVTSV